MKVAWTIENDPLGEVVSIIEWLDNAGIAHELYCGSSLTGSAVVPLYEVPSLETINCIFRHKNMDDSPTIRLKVSFESPASEFVISSQIKAPRTELTLQFK